MTERFLLGLAAGLREGSSTNDRVNGLGWAEWSRLMFPDGVVRGFGDHHAEFWDWAWDMKQGDTPPPFVAAWARGGAKSSTLELVIAATGLRGTRKYWLYVGETQEQADDHVASIAALLESTSVATYYPQHADRAVGKYGSSRGWRRNRLQTRGGLIVDALGLETARRGVKVEHQRPDGIAFDDIDGRHDTVATTKRKMDVITTSILPMGTANTAVAFVQNLVISTGIQSRLVDGKADFLHRRRVSGPIPALYDMKTERVFDEEAGRYRDVITAGRPSWAGQGIKECQDIIDRIGLAAFLRECQHLVTDTEGSLWKRSTVDDLRVDHHAVPIDSDGRPSYLRIAIGVDPSGGKAEIGIVAVGLGRDGRGYVLADRSQPGRLGAHNWGYEVVRLYEDLGADIIAAEANFGGDMVASTIRVISPSANVKLVSASRGKQQRAEPVAALYGAGLVHHVGTFEDLETEMTSWVPGTSTESPNRIDALVWALTELMLQPKVVTGVIGSFRMRK